MVSVGQTQTKLIVMRGNSVAGKSTAARLVRGRLRPGPFDASRGYFRNGVALVQQDYVRRELLGEYDRADGINIELIDSVVRTALDGGFDVILEGMLFAERYADMLLGLTADHSGLTHHWYFDAALEVTLRRHRLKPEAAGIPDSSLVDWYRENDVLPGIEQRTVDGTWTAEHTADKIVKAALNP